MLRVYLLLVLIWLTKLQILVTSFWHWQILQASHLGGFRIFPKFESPLPWIPFFVHRRQAEEGSEGLDWCRSWKCVGQINDSVQVTRYLFRYFKFNEKYQNSLKSLALYSGVIIMLSNVFNGILEPFKLAFRVIIIVLYMINDQWFCSGFCKRKMPLRSITRDIWHVDCSIRSLRRTTQRRWWSASSSQSVAASSHQSLKECLKTWHFPTASMMNSRTFCSTRQSHWESWLISVSVFWQLDIGQGKTLLLSSTCHGFRLLPLMSSKTSTLVNTVGEFWLCSQVLELPISTQFSTVPRRRSLVSLPAIESTSSVSAHTR